MNILAHAVCEDFTRAPGFFDGVLRRLGSGSFAGRAELAERPMESS